MTAATIEMQFSEAMANHGLSPSEVIADGKIHRFDGPEDAKGKKSGWYVLHADGIGAGAFGNWKTDLSETWCAVSDHTLSPEEVASRRSRIEQCKAAAAEERKRVRKRAAEKATIILERARDAVADNPYCQRKKIKPFGLKEFRDKRTLIVPARNASGDLLSLQFIYSDGTKRFLTGGELSGAYCAFGGRPNDRILLCEGFATGATLHEATGLPVAVAFNAGNLLPVAQALHRKMPRCKLIICADDDVATAGNPGLTKATAAARAVKGALAVPDFGPNRPDNATDFNDLRCIDGVSAVTAAVEAARIVKDASTPRPSAPQRSVLLSCAADITPEAITWLWPGWLPAGKLTIVAGSPGTGKTTLALTLAATVSRGGLWPDGTRHKTPGTVLMWSSEDDPADTLVPRLIAAGADLTRIQFIRSVSNEDGEIEPFDPSRDIPILSERLAQIGGARLMIIDPLVSAVSGDAHRVNDVRRDLQALVDMAAAYRCAVLGVSHFAKGGKGTTPAERVIGSQAFVALARMVLVTAKDEAAERRILARAKSNIAPDEGGVSYTLEQVTIDGIEASRVVWGAAIEGSAREILGDVEETDDEEKTERDDAADFLRALLSNGPMSSKEIKADAIGAGYAWRTIERAKRALNIDAKKEGLGGWKWYPPAEDRQGKNEDRHSPGRGGLQDRWRSSATTGVSERQNTANFGEKLEDRHRQESDGLHKNEVHRRTVSGEDAKNPTLYTVPGSDDSLSSSAPDANLEV